MGRSSAAVLILATAGGCVSLDEHNRLKQAHRLLTAERDQVSQELADERKNNDVLRVRLQGYEREGMTKDELLANLRGENDLLDNMRKMTQAELEEALGRIGNITIEGAKLPAPLDSALKRFAEEHPSEVEYDAQRGFVKWKADLVFPLGSDVVKESSLAGLRGFVDVLKSSAAADFETLVVGHTDTTPISRSVSPSGSIVQGASAAPVSSRTADRHTERTLPGAVQATPLQPATSASPGSGEASQP
jgi:outer membrane protein OmpA-like peptidoglycan-associated protein